MKVASTCFSVVVVFSSSVFADSLKNPGFETGTFAGWSMAGDTLIVNSSFGVTPTEGIYQALMSSMAPDDFTFRPVTNPGYPFQPNGSYSGTRAINAMGPFPSALESFLGVPASTLQNLEDNSICFSPGCYVYQGSAIKQSFTAHAGDVVSFHFDFLTDWPNNFALVALDGMPTLLAHQTDACTDYPVASFPPYGQGSTVSATGFRWDCGYQSFSMTLPTSGPHYIGIGVVHGGGDPAGLGALLVDNFGVTTVPEPSTWFLLASGLVGIGLAKRYVRGRTERAGISKIVFCQERSQSAEFERGVAGMVRAGLSRDSRL
jgi:hypothetical protein